MRSVKSTLKRRVALTAALVMAISSLVGAPASANTDATKSITISGFASNSTSLTKAMRVKINKFIRNNDQYQFVTCVGFADRPGSATANSNLGKARATAGCEHAVKRNSDLEVATTRGRWDDTRAGSNIRRVRIILSDSSTAQLTTYFELMGGQASLAETNTTAGGSIVLPTATRAGYEFLGWFSDQYNGTKIGNAGESYTPTRTRILWAQWFVPSSAAVGPSSTLTIIFAGDTVSSGPSRQNLNSANQIVQICETPTNCASFPRQANKFTERTITLESASPTLYYITTGPFFFDKLALWPVNPSETIPENLWANSPGILGYISVGIGNAIPIGSNRTVYWTVNSGE